MNLVHKLAYFTSLTLTLIVVAPAPAATPPASKDPYEILGVTPETEPAEIDRVYNKRLEDYGFTSLLRNPRRWPKRAELDAAYRQITRAMAPAPNKPVAAASPEDLLAEETRAKYMPRFRTPVQLEALLLATHALGEREVVWQLDKLLQFETPTQVRALKIAVLTSRGDLNHALPKLMLFREESQVEALAALAPTNGPFLRLRYDQILRVRTPAQIEAMRILGVVLGVGVEAAFEQVLMLESDVQVEAIRIVASALGPEVEQNLFKLRAFREAPQLEALRIAAPVFKNTLTFRLPTLAKYSNETQVAALGKIVERLGAHATHFVTDALSFTSAGHLIELDEVLRDRTKPIDEAIRALARGCRGELR